MLKKTNKELIKNEGFTLIELVISLTIIAVLSTIGIAAFVNQSRTSALQSGVSDFVSTLNVAKSRAMSQVKPSICVGDLEGYTVTVVQPATNSFKLYVNCGGNDFPISAEKFPANVTFGTGNGETTSFSFFFSVLTNSVQGAGQVTIKGYGSSKVVVVDSAGNIKVN